MIGLSKVGALLDEEEKELFLNQEALLVFTVKLCT